MGDSSRRDEHTIAISLARRRLLDGIRRMAQGLLTLVGKVTN